MKVSLFVTCLADMMYPQVGESVVRLLHRYGCEVDFPEAQTCCGQPAFNSGYQDEAKAIARQMILAFEHSDYVVSPSGSCTGMVHHYYPYLFENEPEWKEKAEQFVHKTYEFTQFLVQVLGVKDIEAQFTEKVTFHPSCHASRLLGIKDEPLMLLNQVNGIEYVDLPHKEDCCGFGGTFAVKMSDMSEAMVCEKVKNIVDTEATVLVSTDMGCLMNIHGRLNKEGKTIRVMHLAELLEEGVKRNEHSR
jgi:L-lactate dehydrogenase complex protein LldE